MSNAEEIHVEEETMGGERPQRDWSEAFKVSGDELLQTVKRLAREVGVRRIVVQDRNERVLLEIPLAMGITGIALLPFYSALALIAALATECTIAVERRATAKEASG